MEITASAGSEGASSFAFRTSGSKCVRVHSRLSASRFLFTRLTSHDVTLHCPAGQFVTVRQLEFAQHSRYVCFYCFHGDEELGGYFLVRVTAGNQTHDFLFSSGEKIEFVVTDGNLPSAECVEHEAGKARAERRVSGSDATDSFNEFGGRNRLGNIPASATSDDLNDIFGRV